MILYSFVMEVFYDMERLEQFEKMYAYIRQNHQETVEQLEKLRGENRQKTATFRQLEVLPMSRTLI